MKVVADKIHNADQLLLNLLEFQDTVSMMVKAVAPYADAGKGRALPRFIAETTTQLNQLIVKDFARRYPAIQDFVVNGENSGAGNQTQRLPNACFLFDTVQKELMATKCVVMDDNKRRELEQKLERINADIIIFICMQFQLYTMATTGEVPMSVSKWCEKMRNTPDVFYGECLMMLERGHQSWFAWEPISPMYEDLQAFDPVFMAECEENNYPLTDEMARQLVEGDADIAMVRGQLADFMKTRTESEVDVTPTTLFSKMKLSQE